MGGNSNIGRIEPILMSKIRVDATERLLADPEMAQKIREAREEIKQGKGVKMDVNHLWK